MRNIGKNMSENIKNSTYSVWFVLEPIDFFKTPTCEGGFFVL